MPILIKTNKQTVIFLLLVGLNSLLAYSELDWRIKLGGLLGFGALGWALIKKQTPVLSKEQPLFSRDYFFPTTGWVALTFGLALALRLFIVNSSLSFPVVDEIENAYCAIHLNSHWSWNLFIRSHQIPALYIWFLTVAIKFFDFSFLILWLVPAIFSFLSVIFNYLAFRAFFSRFFSFSCLLLLGFSFWPVFLGYFSCEDGLMVTCQALAFWILAKLFKADPSRKHALLWIFLGILLGVGFYTYFAWPLIAICIILTLGWYFLHSRFRAKWDFVFCLLAFFLTTLPLGIEAYRENFGAYIWKLLVFNQTGNEAVHWHFWQNAFCFTNLFWTSWPKNYACSYYYYSGWGGLFNPILGSFFFIGTAEWWRIRHHPMAKWIAVSSAVFFLPCLLANSNIGYHLAPLLPILIVTIILGFFKVLESLPNDSIKLLFIGLVFSVSISLDTNAFAKTIDNTNRNFSDLNPMVLLCQNLSKQNAHYGPGHIYSDFCMNEWLPAYLTVGTYSFNSLVNPSLDPGKDSWAAIIADDSCRNLLSKIFTGIAFIELYGAAHVDSGLGAFIPLTSDNRKILEDWSETNQILRETDYMLFNHPLSKSYEDIIRFLRDRESLFQGKPFLSFYYWGKLANIYYWNKQYDMALPAFQKALQYGTNGIVNSNLGKILLKAGRYSEAKKTFLDAGEWDSMYRPSPQTLQELDTLAAQSQSFFNKKPIH